MTKSTPLKSKIFDTSLDVQKNIFSIKTQKIIHTNDDWKQIGPNDKIINVNNSEYFGFRSLEKGVFGIYYNPFTIDNLVKITKYGRKSKSSLHILEIDYDYFNHSEEFIKILNQIGMKIYEINNIEKNQLALYFINFPDAKIVDVFQTFSLIYNYPLGFKLSEKGIIEFQKNKITIKNI